MIFALSGFCVVTMFNSINISSDEGVVKENTAPVYPPSTSVTVERNSQKETGSETPLVAVLDKAAADAKSKRRKKDKNPASTSLEAHQATFTSSDVSMFLLNLRSMLRLSLLSALFASASDAEVLVSWR
jgi:hypothetical protein